MAHPTHTLHSRTGLRKARSILRPGHDPSVRQEILKRAREAMQKAGFELERFDELKRRSNTALREALAKSRAAADERVPAMRDAVARSTEYWLKANKVGDTLSPGPDVFALSTADQISVDPNFSFLSENKAPWANSAQVILRTGFLDDGVLLPFDALDHCPSPPRDGSQLSFGWGLWPADSDSTDD